MTLVQSWIDSLRLLKPKNFKLFAVETLKSIVETYKLMICTVMPHFLWHFIIVFLVFVSVQYFLEPNIYSFFDAVRDYNFSWLYEHSARLLYLMYALLFLAVCFIAYPSRERKDWNYLGACYRKIILYWFILAVCFNVSEFAAGDVFLVLFFLESEGGVKKFFLSIWYAFIMIVFNLPFLMIIGVMLNLPGWLCKAVYLYKYNTLIFISEPMLNIIRILLLPIVICIYANIYMTKIRPQFDSSMRSPKI
jgi:hypothetical protein